MACTAGPPHGPSHGPPHTRSITRSTTHTVHHTVHHTHGPPHTNISTTSSTTFFNVTERAFLPSRPSVVLPIINTHSALLYSYRVLCSLVFGRSHLTLRLYPSLRIIDCFLTSHSPQTPIRFMKQWAVSVDSQSPNTASSQAPSIRLFPDSCTHATNVNSRKIEIAGLNTVVIVNFNTSGLLSAKAIFPTCMVHPNHPRGYLSASLSYPKQTPIDFLEYDGHRLSFILQVHDPNKQPIHHSIFVSPSHPAVYYTTNYRRPQISPNLIDQVSSALVSVQANHAIYVHQGWVSLTCFLLTYTTLQTHPLSSALTDLNLRRNLVSDWTTPVALRCTTDQALSIVAMNYFAKIRAQESVFAAPNLGLVHSPGGDMFYCGVWCNDQAEYTAPALAYCIPNLASQTALATINSVTAIFRYVDTDTRAIPYSVEIDGNYIGRLDRGDAAMYAWGVSLLVLTLADDPITDMLFPNIAYACDLLLDKLNNSPSGVIPSQSDELEGRFPTGTENLSTNCLAILALESAAHVTDQKDLLQMSHQYRTAAATLRKNTSTYFAAADDRIYAYYKGCPDARGWACLSVLADLDRGKQALRHCLQHLWCSQHHGVRTSDTHPVVWDRTTLYAIRAAFRCGLVDLAIAKWREFAQSRLQDGPAAPFCVENSESYAQLSAESALFVRVVVEGLLGLQVISRRRILLMPRCPAEWSNGYIVDHVYFAQIPISYQIKPIQTQDRIQVRIQALNGSTVEAETHLSADAGGGALLLHVPPPPQPLQLNSITQAQYVNILRGQH